MAKDQAASAKKPSTQPTSKGVARKKSSPQKPRTEAEIQAANGGLTGKAALALWDIVITGDGKTATQRNVKLEKKDLESLTDADLIRVEHGARKDEPKWGSKLFVKDKVWDWAAREGVRRTFLGHPPQPPFSRHSSPRSASTSKSTVSRSISPSTAASRGARRRRRHHRVRLLGSADFGPLIGCDRRGLQSVHKARRPSRRASGRAGRRGRRGVAPDAAKGGAVLYPIDDPHRLRPEDEAASLRVAGERRDSALYQGVSHG